MTDDRIAAAQKNIQENLPSRQEYIVTTSGYNDAKARLSSLLNRRKVDVKDESRPRLRRGSGNGGTIDEAGDSKQKPDQDDRPTLKRRDQ